jgi:hypothetical protein
MEEFRRSKSSKSKSRSERSGRSRACELQRRGRCIDAVSSPQGLLRSSEEFRQTQVVIEPLVLLTSNAFQTSDLIATA